MAHEPARDPSAHATAAGSAQSREEAILDQYVEKPSPLRDWVEAKVRQAPWWCISFLVHVIALLILWSWPVTSSADVPEQFGGPVIVDVDTPEPDTIVPPEPQPPVEPPLDLKEYDITETTNLTPTLEKPQDTVKPGDPIENPGGDGTPEEPVWGQTPVIGPPTFIGPPVPRPPKGPGYGPRGELGGLIQGPKHPPGIENLSAVLLWLARVQEKDGSWDAKKWDGAQPYRVGMTGLALLAFQGAGFTHRKGKTFRQVVARALQWMQDNQRDNGSFPWQTFYEQGIATMAVCEAYGMTGDPRLKPMAQRAIDYVVKLQPEHGGYRYNGPVLQGEGDMSVTGWQIMAIKSAILAELKVPPEAVERSRLFLKNTARDYGASSYLAGDQGAGSLAVTSIGLLCRVFLNDGDVYQMEIRQGADFLLRAEAPAALPAEGGASKQLIADLYYTYYSSLAMFQAGPEYWRAWKTMYLQPLKAAQVHAKFDAAGRDIKGSFDPAKEKWGRQGGRVYASAMAALCFEAPYRFLPLYQQRGR